MSNYRPAIDCGSWGSTEILGSDIKETFIWNIKGFKDHRETYKLNKMFSKDYVIKGTNGTSTTWMLEVEPDAGDRYSHIRNVTIWVHNKNARNLRVKIDVSVLSSPRVRAWTKSKSETLNNDSRIEMWSYSTSDVERLLVGGGDLTIVCDITILGLVATSPVDTKEELAKRSTVTETHKPTLNKSREILAENLKKFCLSKEMSDVQIKSGDQTFDAHKFMLSAMSPVFSRMLQSEMKEKRSGLVDLGDTNPKVVTELLKFIYTGSCCIHDKKPDPQIVCELLQVADKYELEHLKDLCQYELSSTLTPKNSLQYFALGEMYGANELKKRALETIVKIRKSIVGTEEWKECAKNRPHLMADIAVAMANLND